MSTLIKLIRIQNKCHKNRILSILWEFRNNLLHLLQKQSSYRFQDRYKRGTVVRSQDNIPGKLRETSNFPVYRIRESAPAESSRPEVATRLCGNKFEIWRTLWIRVPWCETGSTESGSKDSKVPQESLSFFRLNKKRKKSRLRMCRTAIPSILEILRTYITSFWEWYSRYGWWSPRGRRGCCARSSSHSDKSLAANLRPSDLLVFSTASTTLD